jgi:hypothetical protein
VWTQQMLSETRARDDPAFEQPEAFSRALRSALGDTQSDIGTSREES